MKRGLVISLAIATYVLYYYVAGDGATTSGSNSGEEGGNSLESFALEFLEYVASAIATDVAFRGLYNLAKKGVQRLRARGVKTPTEKGVKAPKTGKGRAGASKGGKTGKSGGATAEEGGVRPADEKVPKTDDRIGGATAEEEALAKEGTAAEKAAAEEAEKIAEREAMTAEEAAEKLAEQDAIKEADRLAEEEATRLAEAEASREAEIAAQKLAEEEAARLAEQEAARLAEAEATRIAEETAAKAAAEAARASRFTALLSQVAEGPFGLVMMAISTALYAVLGLDPSMFKPCKEGEFDLATLPAWAQGMISAVPFIGDLFTLVGDLLCFSEKCPEGKENNGGLCYDPCKEGYKSDGAVLCYKQYGDYWENKGFPAAPTLTSITKTVLTNTGVPYSGCGDGLEQDGALCYEPCREGYDGVGPVCWARIQHNDWVGTIPEKQGCDPGQRDDGTSCWEDFKGHGCYDLFGTPWCDFYGCGCIKKALWDRSACPPDKENIDGLCYSKCPAGMEHIPGMPYDCRTIGEVSYTRGAGSVMKCAPGQTEDSLGLCYNQPPEGFEKTTLGMMADRCPEGSTDFGVGCTRESYNRGAGTVALDIYLKERDNYYGLDTGDGYIPGT